MGLFGKLFHYGFDAVLVSTVLAGVRRSTGLTFKTQEVGNGDAKNLVVKYLEVGEMVFDMGVSVIGNTGYFERRLP